MVDDTHQAHQQDQLQRKRDQACERMIASLAIKRPLCLCNRVAIAEKPRFDAVQLRLQLHNFYGIFMHPDAYRQQY